ncbi:DUF1523 family protein [Actinobacillus porcinus]|uniref:Protein of uncharacterized function (DUF1523) n=1 Tax=Actinobacillus porcinus TaxID=51048 RepID=A0ABY6TMW4_9PAST|nr:DUF1523 family protein [Actinobacillus porcinus]MCI5764367.1 DUF1523 family protein [Actinobacillus porcinus]MDY5421839.1 DUF1523 family protein [Actinobacillus porcinus]MDY6215540.1 DUF1523 family protein [Actinobacillus porcinus]VFY93854.1 Protein of uncharacterised function (DUF1523) [Actinobacillus porcinus]VTU09277.1 Protein of uncharacterised function (DUF1523) [Actinobacillus porcinus]
MRKFIKYFLIIVVVLFHAVLFAGINFVFPHYETTHVTGVEVKRVDKDGPITKANPEDGPTRDVYYIYTQRTGETQPTVYRNEDTRWAFPFYFKFDSAVQQARASGFEQKQKRVEIKYYGWNMVMFNEFRNVISMEEVTEDQGSHPILSWIFYALGVLTLFFSIQFIRGWFDSEA